VRVCAITTWPPHRDGIALYSAKLYGSMLKRANVTILANIVTRSSEDLESKSANMRVIRCWKRGSPFYIFQIYKNAMKSEANIFHVQHGWLLYGNALYSSLFPILLAFLRVSRKPVILTLHTIIKAKQIRYDSYWVNPVSRIAIFCITKLAAISASKIIVHGALMKYTLEREFCLHSTKIAVIPHGVEKAVTEKDSKENGEGIQILSLGFLRKSKGLGILIRAFEEVLEECPNAKLIIVGGLHAHDEKTIYQNYKSQATDLIEEHKITFTGFVSEASLDKFLASSDIILLLSDEDGFVEASGALARVADFGKSVICSRIPKFLGDLQDGVNCLMITPQKLEEMSNAIVVLIKDSELRKRLGLNLKNKMKEQYWNYVATKHLELYENI
jgi:glycosyltransferase involved in cell wall biosynthesis